VKKFAPVHAALLIFGKKASKSAWVNQVPIALPPELWDGVGVGELGEVGTGLFVVVGASVGSGVGMLVDASVPVHPSDVQVDSALQYCAPAPQ
jgi:hypothetical protein